VHNIPEEQRPAPFGSLKTANVLTKLHNCKLVREVLHHVYEIAPYRDHMLKILVACCNEQRSCPFQVSVGNFKKPQQRAGSNKGIAGGSAGSKGSNAGAGTKRKGCRCGNATATPGKLTCCGQRCPCYVESKACMECRCRGCRNPHRPGGHKVLLYPSIYNLHTRFVMACREEESSDKLKIFCQPV